MAPQHREAWVDWIRGIAACVVTIFHFNEVRPETGWYGDLTSYGWLGVPVFFVLSGYCIWTAAARESLWGHFLIARFCRIYPPYVFSLAVVLSVVAWRVLTTGTNDIIAVPQTWPAVLATMTLMITPVTDVPGINWVYWTLTYEAAFYFIVTAVIAAKGFGRPMLFLISIASTMTALEDIPGLFFLKHWGLFALGAALVDLRKGRPIFGAILALAAITSVGLREDLPSQIAAATVVGLALLFSLTRLQQMRVDLPPLRWMGDISYSLYLLHVPVGVFFLGRLVQLDRKASIADAVLTDLALLAASLLAAGVAYRWVERPSIAWGRSAFRGLSAPGAPSLATRT